MTPTDPATLAQRAALTSGSDTWHTDQLPGVLPRLMLSDGPHGIRQQREGGDALGIGDSVPATCFPPAAALGSTWNPALAEAVGQALGEEARAQGVHVVLGPGLNIKRSPLGGRNFEYLSEDPHLSGELAAALVRGIQSQGVGAAPKHFAVNNQETDRMRISADVDERTLRELYLPAFETVVRDARPWMLMSAYNRINGTFASEARWLLTGILRDEWGFDGVVVSDWGAVSDRVAALEAGLDLEMPPSGTDDRIVAAIEAGRLPEAALDETVERLRVLAGRIQGERTDGYDADAHDALARTAAAESIVLLRNDGILPLDPARRIAVIGEFARTPRYQGGGSSRVVPTRLATALDALAEHAEVSFAPGYRLDEGDAAGSAAADLVAEAVRAVGATDGALIAEAVDVVTGAEVAVVFLGLPEDAESEGFDRTDLDLPAAQLRLLEALGETGVPLVAVLSNGGVVTVDPWQDACAAVVEGWLLGQAGGAAIADMLFGVTNPSGRLAETLPLSLTDTPAHRHFPGRDGHVAYGEGVFVGYRHYDSGDHAVAYPFGHGLSYTSFAYADVAVEATGRDAWSVSFTVTNTGARAGAEVAQVYVRPPADPMRPAHELRAFAKVTLEPGASVRVTRELGSRAFAGWDAAGHRWRVDPGVYGIEIGASSRDLRLHAEVTCTGDGVVPALTPWSTIAEWRAHPVGGPILSAAMGGASAGVAERAPELLRMIAQTPLIKLTSWGLGLTEDGVEALCAAVAARSGGDGEGSGGAAE